MANIFPGIQIPTNNPIPNPIIPSQQVVVPSVTIPQGFSAVPNQARGFRVSPSIFRKENQNGYY